MAIDWIKVRNTIGTDSTVATIADKTDQPIVAIVGALVMMWSAASDHSLDGTFKGSMGGLDRLVGIPGFAAACIAEGWLSNDGGVLTIPKWNKHNSETARKRAEDAMRKAQERRAKGKCSGQNADKCPESSDTCPENTGQIADQEQEQEQEQEVPDIELASASSLVADKAATTRWPNKAVDIKAIYDAYPKHTAWKAAQRAIEKSVREIGTERGLSPSDAAAWLLGRVRAYAESAVVTTARGTEDWQFIPAPAPWMNQGRYHDSDAEWAVARARAGPAAKTKQDDRAAQAKRILEKRGIYADRDNGRSGDKGADDLFPQGEPDRRAG